MNDIPPEAKQEVAAALGSLVALRFMKDAGWAQKVFYFLGGWAVSKIFGESIQGVIGMNLEATRALTALFGLAICEKMFDVIAALDAKRISQSITDFVERRFKG